MLLNRMTTLNSYDKVDIEAIKLNEDYLYDLAKELAKNHNITNELGNLKSLIKRLKYNFCLITTVYQGLNNENKKGYELCPASEWLLDNYYKVEEQYKSIINQCKVDKNLNLKLLSSGYLKGYPRVYSIALEIVSHTDASLQEDIIINFINEYQSYKKLSIGEIWSLGLIFKISLIEKIRNICEYIKENQEQRKKVEELDFNNDNNGLVNKITNEIIHKNEINSSYIEFLLKRLRKEDNDSGKAIHFIECKLGEFNTTIEEVINYEHKIQALSKNSIGNAIISLNTIARLDWNHIFEALSTIEKILVEDPMGIYSKMDFETRDYYRRKIERLSLKYKVTEIQLAKKAIELAKAGQNYKEQHVGYYIIDKGRNLLLQDFYKGAIKEKKSISVYIWAITICTILISLLFSRYTFNVSQNLWISALVFLITFIPASEIVITFLNWIYINNVEPTFLPKLDLDNGILEENSTVIIIPALLTSIAAVDELIKKLEVYYLGNKSDHLYYAVAGDFKDSKDKVQEKDGEIVKAALTAIDELNKKYSIDKNIFFFFIRERQFNEKENKWMGWERKRGAVVEFNQLLLGSDHTSFKTISSDITCLINKIKYVITLDADTYLPLETAKKLIGTIAHPLNRGILDKDKKIVKEGYGIIQPRIALDIESVNATKFTNLYGGQGGVDAYSTASSDLYQDSFKEGIFTGKGIYDLKLFDEVLSQTIPDNAVLSHDLLEGSYLRTGLASDIELLDGYPSKYSNYIMRLHRWIRGDWQLVRWLCNKVKNKEGTIVNNPISKLSKWKIIDNLRRSLVSVSTLLLIVLGLSIFPGNTGGWLGFALFTILFPLVIEILNGINNKGYKHITRRMNCKVACGFKGVLYQRVLAFIFLPYEGYMMLEGIMRTLYRVYISKKNLLEWTTAAETEKKINNDLISFIIRMKSAVIIALLFVVGVALGNNASVYYVLPIALLWLISPFVAYAISKENVSSNRIEDNDKTILKRLARKTWDFYEDYSNEANNYLPPDNLQIDPPNGVANRTSPTNIGFHLLAILSARDFGFITLTKLNHYVKNTIETIEKLPKWNGHLYNWYNINTLEKLRPHYISTVDSGNFVGFLIALKEGLLEFVEKPILDQNILNGLKDTILLYDPDASVEFIDVLIKKEKVTIEDWRTLVDSLNNIKSNKGKNLLKDVEREINQYFIESDLSIVRININELNEYSFSQLKDKYKEMIYTIDKEIKSNQRQKADLESLKNSINRKQKKIEEQITSIKDLVTRLEKLIDDTDFYPLYDKKQNLFSIGYNEDEQKLTNSCYDLLASEARLASYIAISKKQIPKKHWGKLGRALTKIDGYKALVSWTGTMFEYLMPLLVMKNYNNTLLDETYITAVKAQQKYGRKRNVPWGVSESGYYGFDMHFNYQYRAFGVPDLGLKRGLENDMVISPYSTLLALPVDAEHSMINIKRLIKDGVEGEYGFYEAIDYTPERVPQGKNKGVVKSYMAHHQGMGLISIDNYLNNNIMQTRFHSDPFMKSAETLLQEKIPLRAIITKEIKEEIEPLGNMTKENIYYTRAFNNTSEVLPRCHMLSNGNYSLMVTDRGTGFSKKGDLLLYRWRDDALSGNFGNFIFIRNVNENRIWSATSDPLNNKGNKYTVRFSPDKAEYIRKDGDIETHTQIIMTPEDNGEMRKVTLINHSDESVVLEVTSYFEIVLSTQAADIAHMAFSNLFIKTKALPEYNSLIASRRPRVDEKNHIWMSHSIVVDGNIIGPLEYETNREKFIGRGKNIAEPVALNNSLTNTTGPVLDPIMSLRRRVRIEPGQSADVTYITSIVDSKEEAIDVVKKYQEVSFEQSASLALTRSSIEASYLGLTAKQITTYQEMIKHILFLSPTKEKYEEVIKKNTKGQPGLWAYGISGDLPIVLVVIKSEEDIDIIKEMLSAHEFFRMKGLNIDLLILNEDEGSYLQPLQDKIQDTIFSKVGHDMRGIYVRNASIIPEEDRILFYAVARMIINKENGSLQKQIEMEEVEYPANIVYKELDSYKYKIEKEIPIELIYDNGYGGFNSQGDQYIIKLTESKNTPAPWTNIVANEKFGFTVTERGSGFTWADNSRENKLTPWSNDPVIDPINEVVYLRDDDYREVWSITPSPIRETEDYIVTHGIGYSSFDSYSHGIKQKQTMFVPKDDSIKISLIHLKNESDVKRNITLTYYVRPVIGVNEQVTKQFIETYMNNEGCLCIKNSYNMDFENQIMYLSTSEKIKSYTGDRREFLGENGDAKSPKALDRVSLSNRVGAALDPCGAIQVSIEIDVNEEKELVFLLGREMSEEEVARVSKAYKDIKYCKNALVSVTDRWKELLDTVQVKTPDKSMDLLINNWLIYQTLGCRIWARSAFYQSGGAYGYRDQLQDSMNVMAVIPEATRKQILLHCAHQYVEGDVQHWWHPVPGDKGIRTRFSDDLLWLPFVTTEYVNYTGDQSILDEVVHFLEEPLLEEGEDERYGIPSISEEKGTVYDHCIRAIERGIKVGKHGIPLMGSGDWNDGMNTVGNKGKGESIWLGWFIYYILNKFDSICKIMKDEERGKRYKEIAKEIGKSIEEHAWDGKWYRRAYFDDGTPLGSIENSECTIDSLAQSWAVISGAGSEDRQKMAMESVEKHLVKKDEGMILLFTPPFNNSNLSPGYIKSYVPGVRENGGQYTHAATWVINAFAAMGDGDKAQKLYNLINPINHTSTAIESFNYKVEPYLIAADVYSTPHHMRRGGWTGYTGASGWMYRVGLEEILGLKKKGNRLVIDPCIPKDWKEYEMRYRFNNTYYHITIKNPKGVHKKIDYIIVDGVKIDEKSIELDNKKERYDVEVYLG